MTRGPYSLATKGMTAWEAREWWEGHHETRCAYGHSEDDLGPEMKYSVRSQDMGRKRKDRMVVEGEERDYYHPATVHGEKPKETVEVEEGPVDWMSTKFVYGRGA